MSEYQYYEFLAVDRPLTQKQIEAVRKFSTRAKISTMRFVNEYHWGDFRGDPNDFLTRYFDLMVYFANWGTHRLLIGLPAVDVDLRSLRKYKNNFALEISTTENRVLLDFSSEDDEGDDLEESSAWMASLAPTRTEILAGDLRPLYLAWLAGASLDDDVAGDSPPIPAGLNQLTPAQKTLAEFLRVDQDFLAAAARNSPPFSASLSDVRPWIASLPKHDKDRMLASLLTGDDPHVTAKLLRQYRAQTISAHAASSLSLEDLRAAAEKIRTARESAERQRADEARERREAKVAAEREKRLKKLTSRQEQAWQQVEQILDLKQRKAYDQAFETLSDLHEIAVRHHALTEFLNRISALRQTHRTKRSFVQRLENASLLDS